MNTKTLDFPFELKALDDKGIFSGYGSAFGVKDAYDEIVAPGAFADSLAEQKAKGRLPAMLWQHRSDEPIGVYTDMGEDNIGLALSGQLALGTVRGAEAYALLKMGAISGLSIGYQVRDESFDRVTGILTLKKLNLYEVSLVTFAANPSAQVTGVKSIEAILTLRDAEKCLRDAGLSRREAVAFIARVKCLSQSDSDEGDMQQIAEALKRRSALMAA